MEDEDVVLQDATRVHFTEGFAYHRNGAHRTPQKAMPFKALACFQEVKMINGAVRGLNSRPHP